MFICPHGFERARRTGGHVEMCVLTFTGDYSIFSRNAAPMFCSSHSPSGGYFQRVPDATCSYPVENEECYERHGEAILASGSELDMSDDVLGIKNWGLVTAMRALLFCSRRLRSKPHCVLCSYYSSSTCPAGGPKIRARCPGPPSVNPAHSSGARPALARAPERMGGAAEN